MNYKGLPLDLTAASVAPQDQPGTWPLSTAMWTWEAANPPQPFTPQGITSFVDEKAAQKLVVVSWHSDNGGDARISYLLKDDKGDQRYGHARLGDPGETSSLHAGGIACFANRLLVADTKIGIVAFDVANPRKGSDGFWQIDRCETYCLAREISDASLRLFSFADVDWTDHDHPMLLTGTYVDKSLAAKLHPSVLGWALEGSGPERRRPIFSWIVRTNRFATCKASLTTAIPGT